MMKKDVLIHCILLLRELDLEIRDKKSAENVVADHLSYIPNSPCNKLPINDDFSNEQLLVAFRKLGFGLLT